MNDSLADLRARPHLSVSALKLYLQCPRKFKFQYIERAPADFRPVAFVFGTAWHATIGRWLTALPNVPSVSELRDHLRDDIMVGVADDGARVLFEDDEDEGKLVDVAMKMLDTFLAKVRAPDMVLGVEVAFSIDLAHPMTGEVLPVPLIGGLDAVVLEQGRGQVWELKTAKKKYAVDQLDFDLQPTAYAKAARVLGYQDVGLKFLVTTKGSKPDVQVEQLTRHRADEDELVEIAFGVHRAVAAGVDHPVRGWWCRSCQFASRCR
jgi:hypothetical protein